MRSWRARSCRYSRVPALSSRTRSRQSVPSSAMALLGLILPSQIRVWSGTIMRIGFPSSLISQSRTTEKMKTGQNAASSAYTTGMVASNALSSWGTSCTTLWSNRIASLVIRNKQLFRASKRPRRLSCKCAREEMKTETQQSLTGLALALSLYLL